MSEAEGRSVAVKNSEDRDGGRIKATT